MFTKYSQKRVTDHIQGKGKPKSFLDVGPNIPKNIEDNKKIKSKDIDV